MILKYLFLSLGKISASSLLYLPHFILSPTYTSFLPISFPIQFHNSCKRLFIISLFLHMHVIANISSENCGLFFIKTSLYYCTFKTSLLIKQYTVGLTPSQMLDIQFILSMGV